MHKKQSAENQQFMDDNEEQIDSQTTPEEVCISGDDEQNSDKMTEETQQWQDKYMRLSAEFDNFRKRTIKEKAELAQYGGAEVLLMMLGTADDFDRALQHITDAEAKSGVELIYQKFLSGLNSKGVSEMEVLGKPFDVDFAEAIAKVPAQSDDQKGLIMDVVEKGYTIGDKVLRFAKVVVYE